MASNLQVFRFKILDITELPRTVLMKVIVKNGDNNQTKDAYIANVLYAPLREKLAVGNFVCTSKCSLSKFDAIQFTKESKVYSSPAFECDMEELEFYNSATVSLSEARDMPPRKRVTIEAKIDSISCSSGTSWRRQDLKVSDSLTSLSVKLWNAGALELPAESTGRNCIIKNLEVCEYKNIKELKNTKQTVVQVIGEGEETIHIRLTAFDEEQLSLVGYVNMQLTELTFAPALIEDLRAVMDSDLMVLVIVGNQIVRVDGNVN